MDFRIIGEFDGTPAKYEDFSAKLLEPVCREFLKDEVLVVIYNHHIPERAFDDDELKKTFSDYISANPEENKNKVFIVNWAWHHQCGFSDIRDYMNQYQVANNDACAFRADKKYDNEYNAKNKNGVSLSTWRIHKDGYSVVYFLWDAFHVVSENARKEWEKEFLVFAINQFNSGVFLEKYGEMTDEGSKDKRLEGRVFTSIETMANTVAGANKKDIIEEMLDKAPIKEVVLYLNQCANTGNVRGARQTRKPLFVTKEQARDWLRLWAEKKWQYYVMFGRKFSITRDINIALRPDKDEILIRAMMSDFKRKFIKYAPILDMFDTREFLNNKIGSHSELNKYKPIQSGMKLSKYLSDFFDDKEFDIELSKFIQNKEVNSTVHISINPMDYMTASVTKHDWRSCHALHDGEYGLGCLSYMFDEGSLIAFMASDREYAYDLDCNGKPFMWNSKSWRQMIYGSKKDNMFIFSREYPQKYQNEAITSEIRNLLERNVAEFCDIPHVWVKKNNGAKNSRGTVYENARDAKHYDDIPANQTVLIRHKMNMEFSGPIVIGSNPKCPITGLPLDGRNRVFHKSVL